MKKLALTATLLLALTLGAAAQSRGFFDRGYATETGTDGSDSPLLPHSHNLDGDQDAAPLSGGVALLFSLGVMYLTAKRRKED